MLKLCLTIVLASAFACPSGAATIPRGTVTAVDAAAKSFTCHWRTGDRTYGTTDKTVFRMGRKRASFSDLKPGEIVQVSYHRAGGERVSDRVTIKP